MVNIEKPVVNITALPASSPSLPIDSAIVYDDTEQGADIITISDTNSTPLKPSSIAIGSPIAGSTISLAIIDILRFRLLDFTLLILNEAPSSIIAIGVVHSDRE